MCYFWCWVITLQHCCWGVLRLQGSWSSEHKSSALLRHCLRHFLWSCHSWETLTCPQDQDQSVHITVLEVFPQQTCPDYFSRDIEHRKLIFKVFVLCKVSLLVWVVVSVLGIDYSCRLGVQQRGGLSPGAPLHFICRANSPWTPACVAMFYIHHIHPCWWQLHTLVLSWLRKVALGAFGPGSCSGPAWLVCMGWAGLRSARHVSCPAAVWLHSAPGLLQGTGLLCLCLCLCLCLASAFVSALPLPLPLSLPLPCLCWQHSSDTAEVAQPEPRACVLLSWLSVAKRPQPSHAKERGHTTVTQQKPSCIFSAHVTRK